MVDGVRVVVAVRVRGRARMQTAAVLVPARDMATKICEGARKPCRYARRVRGCSVGG